MSKLISFSIAAYNVEQFLPELLNSIIDIDLTDEIEVIIVNDGSKDGTERIASEYSRRYPDMIKVVNKENNGYGSTINTGVSIAQGKYFKVLDGDDFVDSKNTRLFLKELKLCDADMVFTNCRDIYYDKNFSVINEKVEKFENVDLKKIYTFDELSTVIPWVRFHCIFFKTSILKNNNIIIDENCFYTDSEFVILPLLYVNTIQYFDFVVYNYRLYGNSQSISQQSRKKNIKHAEIVQKRLINFFNENNVYLEKGKRNFILYGISMSCCWLYYGYLMFAPEKEYKIKLLKLDHELRENNKDIYLKMLTISGNTRLMKIMRLTDYFFYSTYGTIKKFFE